MYVPQSQILSDRAGGQLVVTLQDPALTPGWSITIQHMVVTPGATAEGQIQQHLESLDAAGHPFELIENRAVIAGNVRGQLCYIRQSAGGDDGEAIVAGWLILPAGPDVMLVFSILAMPEELPFLRNQLEAAFGTINLQSAAEVSLLRRSRVENGRALLEGITAERLRPLIGTHQWSRIYRVDQEGHEHEVGYTLLEVYEAKRGALNPKRPESSYSAAEKQDGIMVRLQGRVIGDVQRRVFYDSIALYWMAWDQSEEAWSVRGTQRQGQAQRSESETGVRVAASAGHPIPTLQVIRQRSSDYQRDPYEWSVPDVYLSQALAAVLGRLMPRDVGASGEYSYYFYNFSHSVPQLTQRTDRWEVDDRGRWKLTTRLSVDTPPIVSLYSATGEFLETRRPDGSVTVPTSIERIRQIWLSKGLPIGDE